MDFYSHQTAARRQTRFLIFGFILAVTCVVVALDFVFAVLFARTENGPPSLGGLLACTLFLLAIIGCASLYKSMTLRGGGGVVAQSMGGVRIERDTGDLKRKRLHNVVEEMAIASGVPLPEIYVLEQEGAINAFAAGHTPANAAIAVTQGALERLNRDQLQGVIAHEFSHILNGDMRLNIQLMGWLFGLLVISLIGRTVLRLSPRSRKGAPAILLAALALVALGSVGLLAGRLLQAAVSRQRERLADASAVQFTRNPFGLKDALIKIAGFDQGSRLVAADAEQVAHMLFAPGLSRLFATHPPLAERIKALDPSFEPRELPRIAQQRDQDVTDAEELTQLDASIPHAAPVAVTPRAVAALVGAPDTVHVEHAKELRVGLPQNLREFVETSGRARAVVVAVLLSREPGVRAAQMRLVERALPPPALAAVNEIAETAASLAPMLRLPALMQLFPALRRSTRQERAALSALVGELVHADARVEVFEYCLGKLLETLFQDEMDARAPHGRLPLDSAEEDIHTLFAVLARAGAANETQARRAYEAGMHLVFPMRRPDYRTYEDWPRRLDSALPVLEKLHPFGKQTVIEGLVRAVSHDDVLSVEEAELLRTACALMHCPLPPILPRVSQ